MTPPSLGANEKRASAIGWRTLTVVACVFAGLHSATTALGGRAMHSLEQAEGIF